MLPRVLNSGLIPVALSLINNQLIGNEEERRRQKEVDSDLTPPSFGEFAHLQPVVCAGWVTLQAVPSTDSSRPLLSMSLFRLSFPSSSPPQVPYPGPLAKVVFATPALG